MGCGVIQHFRHVLRLTGRGRGRGWATLSVLILIKIKSCNVHEGQQFVKVVFNEPSKYLYNSQFGLRKNSKIYKYFLETFKTFPIKLEKTDCLNLSIFPSI